MKNRLLVSWMALEVAVPTQSDVARRYVQAYPDSGSLAEL